MRDRILMGMMAIFLVAGILQAVPDDEAATRLLREARDVLGRDLDPTAAQSLLESALLEAVSSDVKGRILLELAHVSWFRLDPSHRVNELLDKAVSRIGPPTRLDNIYPEAFLRHWRRVARKGAAPSLRYFRIDGVITGMSSADHRFANIYGHWHPLPELRLGVRIRPHWFAWVSGASFSFRGTLPVVDRDIKGSQRFLAVGGGWTGKLKRNFHLFLAAGPQMTWFEEESRLDIVSMSRLGFVVRADLEWRHKSGFFVLLTAGYGGASFEWSDRNARSGGMRVGGGLGVSF